MQKIKSVLFIDDDEITNKLNMFLFKKMGIAQELLVAQNGKVALEIIEERRNNNQDYPDLILLDINMPVMNGFEFLHEMEKNQVKDKASLIIMMLTTSVNQKDLEKANNPLITKFINKPLTELVIKELVENYFDN